MRSILVRVKVRKDEKLFAFRAKWAHNSFWPDRISIPAERNGIMKQDNRVLSRKNARELTFEETGQVYGAFQTGALCSAPSPRFPHGDGPAIDCGGR